jgi:DNA-binding NtrC family response regulator
MDYRTALALFRSGRFSEILASAGTIARRINLLPEVEHRLLVAEILAWTAAGNGSELREVVRVTRENSPGSRAWCDYILGFVEQGEAEFDRARTLFQSSHRLAVEAKDWNRAAKAQLAVFRLLAAGCRDVRLRALLSEARSLVTRSGDPHLVAYLHDSVALMESQTGALDEAERHLQIATSVLERYPHTFLEQIVHIGRCCVASIRRDFATAELHAREARRIGESNGVPSTRIELNEMFLDAVTGRFVKANAMLRKLAALPRSPYRMTANETLARLHLAFRRTSDAQLCIEENLRAGEIGGVSDYYPVRLCSALAAHLLLQRRQFRAAYEHAEHQLQRATQLGDTPLTIGLVLIQADALAAAGDVSAASHKLFEALALGALDHRQERADYYDVSGRVLSQANATLSIAHQARARRIWRQEGDLLSQVRACPASVVGSLRNMRQADIDAMWTIDGGPVASDDAPHSAVVRTLDAIAAALTLAEHSALAAAELQDLANALGCGALVDVQQLTASRGTTATQPQLVCVPGSDPVQNVVSANILTVWRTIEEAGRARRAARTQAALWPESESTDEDSIFASEDMLALRSTARKIAATTVPVLVTGETGTGKEIVARAIHAASPRANTTFLPFNCSVAPRDMVDAQLFGHRRGAFTGATEHAPGVIRAAAGGTLFLDEIGESPLEVQPKLLRFLESGEIHPLGEAHPQKVDVRIIAATNVDLDAAVSSGRFREDLFYRLNIVRLHLPPLRERRVEIPVFAQHYLQKHAREQGKGDLRLAEETMEYLLLYKWPGNVRQLANEMRRLAALAEADAVLMPEHLSPDILASRRTVPASERPLDPNEVVVRLDQPVAAATEHLERAMLQYALKQCGGRMEETARALGLSRKGLYLKRLRFGLEAPGEHVRTA